MNIQQQADSIVENFTAVKTEYEHYDIDGMYVVEKAINYYAAVKCAIIYYEGLLGEHKYCLQGFTNRIPELQSILIELKSRL
jgi:hypothetical protein